MILLTSLCVCLDLALLLCRKNRLPLHITKKELDAHAQTPGTGITFVAGITESACGQAILQTTALLFLMNYLSLFENLGVGFWTRVRLLPRSLASRIKLCSFPIKAHFLSNDLSGDGQLNLV